MKSIMEPIYIAYNNSQSLNVQGVSTDNSGSSMKLGYEKALGPIKYKEFTLWMSSQKVDRMKFWLRINECLTFGFSISFFLFI